jgi:Sec-independent protein secretion pathway component TatC
MWYHLPIVSIAIEVLMQITGQKRRTELSLPVWVALFVVGIAFAGAGRFFGWRENPSSIWHEWAPLATVVLAGFVCLFGYLRFAKGSESENSAKRWTGLIICALGLTMIGTSFLFKYVIPLLFG